VDLDGIGDMVNEGQTAGVYGAGFAVGSLAGISRRGQGLRLVLTRS
jgi:hypothetical protein